MYTLQMNSKLILTINLLAVLKNTIIIMLFYELILKDSKLSSVSVNYAYHLKSCPNTLLPTLEVLQTKG